MPYYKKHTDIYFILALLVITLIVYLPVFQNGFLNWDDNRYITENKLIQDLTLRKGLSYFTTYYDGHYHPLTLLSLAIDYKLGGLDPWWFHFTNLLLHLINITLVFYFISLLFSTYRNTIETSNHGKLKVKSAKNPNVYWIVPAVVALLFAIHPANVESVAWMSERKNVLFTTFFILSLLLYVLFVKSDSKKQYIFSFLLFVAGVLSKVTAVSLVFTLVGIDYLLGRKLNSKKVILEKIPFLLFTIAFIVVGIFAQRHTWGFNEETGYHLLERMPLAANSLLQYLVKLIVPYNLSGFYPYPEQVNGTIPPVYWLSFIPLFFLLLGLWILLKKNKTIVAFGLLFFLINIIFLIKLVDFPIGNYKMGDRYLYIPCIGIFFIIAYVLYLLAGKINNFPNVILKLRPLIYLLVLTIIIVYANMAHQRVKVWKNDITLFSDVVKSYPKCPLAWNNIGMGNKFNGDKQEAIEDFNKALELDNSNQNALLNRGSLLAEIGKPELAIIDFTKLLQLNPEYKEAYLNRAIALAALKQWQAAINDYNKAIKAMPDNTLAITNRGVAKASLGELDSAIADFTKAIEINPLYSNSYFNRGNAKARKNDFAGAIYDFTKAITCNPQNAVAFYHRANAYLKSKYFKSALEDYSKAITINPGYLEAYMNRADTKVINNDFNGAVDDLNEVIRLDSKIPIAYYKKAYIEIKLAQYELACADLHKAKELGMNISIPEKCNNFITK